MSAPEPESVVVDSYALEDAVFMLGLMEDFLISRDEADALVAHYGRPTTPEALADWVGTTALYLRRRLQGIPQ
jgi:hypothetical protein